MADSTPIVGRVEMKSEWDCVAVSTAQRFNGRLAITLDVRSTRAFGVKPGDKLKVGWAKLRDATEEEEALRTLRRQLLGEARAKIEKRRAGV